MAAENIIAALSLNWTDPRLNPNARKHWRVKHEAIDDARRYARLATDALTRKPNAKSYSLNISVAPPDKRRRDIDNVLASLKPTIDGMADALGIDDSAINKIVILRQPVQKGGQIRLWITEN